MTPYNLWHIYLLCSTVLTSLMLTQRHGKH